MTSAEATVMTLKTAIVIRASAAIERPTAPGMTGVLIETGIGETIAPRTGNRFVPSIARYLSLLRFFPQMERAVVSPPSNCRIFIGNLFAEKNEQ